MLRLGDSQTLSHPWPKWRVKVGWESQLWFKTPQWKFYFFRFYCQLDSCQLWLVWRKHVGTNKDISIKKEFVVSSWFRLFDKFALLLVKLILSYFIKKSWTIVCLFFYYFFFNLISKIWNLVENLLVPKRTAFGLLKSQNSFKKADHANCTLDASKYSLWMLLQQMQHRRTGRVL